MIRMSGRKRAPRPTTVQTRSTTRRGIDREVATRQNLAPRTRKRSAQVDRVAGSVAATGQAVGSAAAIGQAVGNAAATDRAAGSAGSETGPIVGTETRGGSDQSAVMTGRNGAGVTDTAAEKRNGRGDIISYRGRRYPCC